jgi:hypothetical protein
MQNPPPLQPEEEPVAAAPNTGDDLDKRLAFARTVLESTQALIRAMDFKAQFLIVASGVLTGSLLPILTTANDAPGPLGRGWSGIGMGLKVCVCVLLPAIILAVSSSVAAMFPRSGRKEGLDELPGLIYPPLILARYPGYAAYNRELRSHTPDELMKEYAHLIVDCATIFRRKQILVQYGLVGLSTAFVCWAVLVGIKIAQLLG